MTEKQLEDQTQYRFTLIHGTFGADSGWLNDSESDKPAGFRARLASSLNRKVEFGIPPAWGASSRLKKIWDLTNAARLSGADSLKNYILSQPRSKKEKHFLIAHSHGGNVAMYAMQDPQVQDRVDGIICMATPFLFPRQRPLSILTLFVSLMIMVVGMSRLIWSMDLLNKGWMAWLGSTGLMIVAIAIPAFLIWIVASERYNRRVNGDPKLQEHIAKLSYSDPKKPILLVRSSGDEASGLLRGTQFLNWLAGMVMRIGGRQIYILLCIGALILSLMAYMGLAWVPESTFAILGAVLTLCAALMVIMLMVLTVSRILVGLDAWRWVGELETMIEDGPPGIQSELVVITPRHPEGGLSHTAVYSEVETTNAIARWCSPQDQCQPS